MRLYTKLLLPAVFLTLASCGVSSSNDGLPQATLPLPENDTTGIVVSTTNQMGYVVIEASAGVVPDSMDLVVQVVDATENPDAMSSAGCEGEVPVCPEQNAFGECRQTPFADGSVMAMTEAEVADYLWISFQDFETCETTDAMEVQVAEADIEIMMGDIEEMSTEVTLNSVDVTDSDSTNTATETSVANGGDTVQEEAPQNYPQAPVGEPQPVKPRRRPRPKPTAMIQSQTPLENPNLPSAPLPPGEQILPPLEGDAPLLPPPGESTDPALLPPGEQVLPPLDFQEPPPPDDPILPPLINGEPITELWPNVRDYRGETLFNVMQQTQAVLFQRIFSDHTVILFATNLDVPENLDDPGLSFYIIRADRFEIDKPMIVTASIFVGKSERPVEVFEALGLSPDGESLPQIVFRSSLPEYERVFPVNVMPTLLPPP